MIPDVPVRFTFAQKISEPACSFTAHMPFNILPAVGHKISLQVPGYDPMIATVSAIVHFPTKRTSADYIIVTDQIIFHDYDRMLRTIDWLKTAFETTGFTSQQQPESYYTFYRILVNILGRRSENRPQIKDNDDLKIVAESVRAILMAEDAGGVYTHIDGSGYDIPTDKRGSKFSPEVRQFHQIALSKRMASNDEVDLFDVVKEWEPIINKDRMWKWSAAPDVYQAYAVVAITAHGLL